LESLSLNGLTCRTQTRVIKIQNKLVCDIQTKVCKPHTDFLHKKLTIQSDKPLKNISIRKKTKLRGFGLRANYADRATAACWRSSANFADRGCCVVSATNSNSIFHKCNSLFYNLLTILKWPYLNNVVLQGNTTFSNKGTYNLKMTNYARNM
jgi:hypothetical protein